MAKAKPVKFNSPKGELAWVTITGEGKESLSGKLQYVANLLLSPKTVPAHQECIDKINAFWEENKPQFMGKRKAKSLGYYLCDPLLDEEGNPVLDDEDQKVYDPNGRVALAFKTATTFPDGSTKVVKTFNSKAKEVALGTTRIGNGSIGYISGNIGIYEVTDSKGKAIDAGVTLYLDAIQITKLVEYSADTGFEADEEDEDGFTGEENFEGVPAEQESAEQDRKSKPRL